MPVIYIETSALVKRYVQEKGTEVMDELFQLRRPVEFFALSTFAVLELKSALRRLVKGGMLSQSQYQDSISDFSNDVPSVSIWLPVDNVLIEEASATLEKHALRAGDAMHFAAVLRTKRIAEDAAQALVVMTSDSDLVDAGKNEGITVINLEDDGALEQLRGLR